MNSLEMFEKGLIPFRPCIVCGDKPFKQGLWEPAEKLNPLFGTKSGRYKHLIYCVCEKHYPKSPEGYELLKKVLITEFVKAPKDTIITK